MTINSDILFRLRELFITNYAFSFSFIVYLMALDVLTLNIQKAYRYKEVYWLISVCVTYCVLYQFGTIRWFIVGLNTKIPKFDEKFWMWLEFFTQVIYFVFLYAVKQIMKSHKHNCEGVDL